MPRNRLQRFGYGSESALVESGLFAGIGAMVLVIYTSVISSTWLVAAGASVALLIQLNGLLVVHNRDLEEPATA